MTKKEAIEEFARSRFHPIPTDWVRVIAEHFGEYPNLPMWGTMWEVDRYWGEKIIKKSCLVSYDTENGTEEMAGAYNVLDIYYMPTAVYVYEIDGRFLIGVHSAGWDFYDGVWDMLYDLFGMNWHEEEEYDQKEMCTANPVTCTMQ